MNASTQPARLRPFRPQPFGRYTLLSHLATGGMGEIYLARLEGAQGFEKLCVIKKILPQLAADAEFTERFVGEARTLVRLSHGSIAQVLDSGVEDGEAFMALEHVDGKDLRKVAARVRDRQVPLPLTFILYVMGRVLDALAYAHRKKDDDGEELKLVHRDISPQNILISYEGEVKVIDFGLAKSRLSAAKTNPSIILGKFLYMSPEQARHQPVDRRSDLYAVGLCLYELISGKNPFDTIHPGELMTAVANPKIAPLDEVEPLTPRVVTALVAKALAVEPSQRFQTAEEFRGRLQTCLMEIDVSAGPESVSRFMRELFAADFQSERRLLASLKEVPRVPPSEARPSSEEGSSAPRPTLPAMLPAKTIRLDGPVEPLSFRPTPRSREGAPVNDGETRPGVMVDESTRPAFPIESLEEEARIRAARQAPDSAPSTSVEVGPEAYVRSEPAPAPAPAPAPRPAALTREVPMGVLPPAAIPGPAPRPATLTREVPMAVLPPEAIPPVEPQPGLHPTELALPAVAPPLEMPWEDPASLPPGAATAEPTEPRAEPLRTTTLESQLSDASRAPAVPQRPVMAPPPVAAAPPAMSLAPRPASEPAATAVGPAPQRPVAAVPAAAPGVPRSSSASPAAAPVAPRPAPAPASVAAVPAAAPVAPRPAPAPAQAPRMAAPPVSAPAAAPGVPPAAVPPAAVPPRTGVVMMPAVSVAPGGPPPPPRTASMTGMPAVAAPPDEVGLEGELSASDDVPGTEESELPIVTPEMVGHDEAAVRLGELDTNPRFSVPSREALHEDTQPRVVRDGDTDPRVAVRHDDTQPRVVLDEALLRDVEQEEKSSPSNPSRPRTATRRPRSSSVSIPAQAPRRTGSVAAVRPAPARVEAPGEEYEDEDVRVSMPSHDETRRTAIPVRPGSEAEEPPAPAAAARRPSEDTRRAAVPASPQRKAPVMLAVGLLALLLLGAIAMLVLSPALRMGMGIEQQGTPPPAQPIPIRPPPGNGDGESARPAGRTAAADVAPPDSAPAQPAPTPAPEAVPAVAAAPAEGPGNAGALAEPAKGTGPAVAVPANGTVAAEPVAEPVKGPEAVGEAAPTPNAGSPAPVAATAQAAAPETPVQAQAPAAATDLEEAEELLSPLTAPVAKSAERPKGSSKKRGQTRLPIRSKKDYTPLQVEWRQTDTLFNKLEREYTCQGLQGLQVLCTVHKDIARKVGNAGDYNDLDVLDSVLELKRKLKALQSSTAQDE